MRASRHHSLARGVVAHQVRAEPIARTRDRGAKGTRGGVFVVVVVFFVFVVVATSVNHAEHALEVGLRLGVLVPRREERRGVSRRRGLAASRRRRARTARRRETLHLVRGDHTRAEPALGGVERLADGRGHVARGRLELGRRRCRGRRVHRASRPHRFAVGRRGHHRPGVPRGSTGGRLVAWEVPHRVVVRSRAVCQEMRRVIRAHGRVASRVGEAQLALEALALRAKPVPRRGHLHPACARARASWRPMKRRALQKSF